MNLLSPAPCLQSIPSVERPKRAKARVFYVDVVRSCACVLVVASHVFAPICAAMQDYPLWIWGTFNVMNSLIRPCAALYIMISGKIFLGSSREDSYFGFVWKRYARLFLPFFVWSIIYASYAAPEPIAPFSFKEAILQFLKGPTAYHLWFMYLILGLYLVMPLMRRFVRSATSTDLAGVLAVWMGFLTLQALVPSYAGTGPATTLLSYSGYAILGYALDKMSDGRKWNGWWTALWLGIILFNAAGTYLLTIENNGQLNEKLYYGAAPLVALQGAAMFLLLKNIDEKSFLFRITWLRRMVLSLSRHSYNIYLNHAFFIGFLALGWNGYSLTHDTGPNPIVGVTVTTLAVLACSLGISVMFQRLPVIWRFFVISFPDSKPAERPSYAPPENILSAVLPDQA